MKKSHRVLVLACLTLPLVVLFYTLFFPFAPPQTNQREKARGELQAREKDAKKASETRGPKPTREEDQPLTPVDAKRMLTEFQQLKSITERSSKISQVIRRLCLSGYSEDAWGLIEENPGQVRTKSLGVWFFSAGLTADKMTRKLPSLANASEAPLAIAGYLRSLPPDGINLLMENQVFKSYSDKLTSEQPDALKRLLAGSLEYHSLTAKGVESQSKVAAAAANYHQAGNLDDDGLISVLKASNAMKAVDKWNLLAEHLTGGGESFRNTLVEQMIMENPAAAMASISKMQNNIATADIGNALLHWGAADSAGAGQWFEQSKGKLTTEQHDAAVKAFIELAVTFKESDGAIQWASQLHNPEYKAQILARLQDNLPQEGE